ncbi:SRPBCC domain-containing protein [Flavimaricola marinus]|uniref:Activator of Hsp90 ATPase homologue 1/2-like C-terminal domain-containing protein n=1 Tax=Flavimaricola marinus TaxID=1819565 RepID=A0A238LKS8_9RHOB|nr:SRPBCC domain-containing protein [Flavimaricola marinus]SMY09556.1 hypothetical protein LOM8899_03723 [Flavimaricola marinus]
MPKDTLAPICKSIVVPLDPAAAFKLFTEGFGTWWPVASHSVSAAKGDLPKYVSLEPRKGGRIVETTAQGRKEVWGRISQWEPGVRLDIDWHVGRDASEATQVSVVFEEEGSGTRIDLTHGGFDRFADASVAMTDEYTHGWGFVLQYYRAAGQLVRGKITT